MIRNSSPKVISWIDGDTSESILHSGKEGRRPPHLVDLVLVSSAFNVQRPPCTSFHWLRLGEAYTKKLLYRDNPASFLECTYGQRVEDTHHLLLICRRVTQRQEKLA